MPRKFIYSWILRNLTFFNSSDLDVNSKFVINHNLSCMDKRDRIHLENSIDAKLTASQKENLLFNQLLKEFTLKKSIQKIMAKLSSSIKVSPDNESFHELQIAVMMDTNKDLKSTMKEIKVIL